MLNEVGYSRKDIYVFMVYNFDMDFTEMSKKLRKCKRWGVQIADCRFRPLNQTFDNYNPRKEQTNEDYYIHLNWTDAQIRLFRKQVRQQNICIRHGFKSYDKVLERQAAREKRKSA